MAKQISRMLLLVLVLVCSGGYAEPINGIDINFVSIGNTNNAPDTTGYGAVDYNYRISQTEISVTQFQASGLIAPASSDNPVSNITWNQAAQYCNWLTTADISNGVYTISGNLVTGIDRSYFNGDGKAYVLPTEDEWYKAAYYKPVNDGSYSLYANGTSNLPTNGVNAVYDTSSAWTVEEGTFEQNGTKNMMGNVFEWLETPVAGTFSFDGSDLMVLRGGAVGLPDDRLRSDFRVDGSGGITTLTTSDFNQVVGLRIVEIVPEPGTMSLMGLSTVGLFFTRTVRRRKRLGQSLLPVRREHVCDMFDSELDCDADLEVENHDIFSLLWSVLQDGCVKLWQDAVRMHQSIDKAFWNRMVVVHERRVARRIRLRKTLRKKALDGFDAFLMRIMK